MTSPRELFTDTNPPLRCPNGHPLGPHRVLVGWTNLRVPPCRTWTCRRCDTTIYALEETGTATTTLTGL